MSIWPRVQHGIRPQLLSTEHDCRHAAGVVNCCKQSSSVALTTSLVWRRSRTRWEASFLSQLRHSCNNDNITSIYKRP